MEKRAIHPGLVALRAVVLAATLAGLCAAQPKAGASRVGNADLGGVVTSSKGPEVEVWMIAETHKSRG